MDAQDDVKQYLSLIVAEYKALRDEIKQVNTNMFFIFQFGFAALAGVIVAAFTQWNAKHEVVLLVFYVIVPAICGMTMILWLGEAIRFKRAGDYIYFIPEFDSVFTHYTVFRSRSLKMAMIFPVVWYAQQAFQTRMIRLPPIYGCQLFVLSYGLCGE